jgi:uncharacterized protein DUF3883
LTEEPGSLAHMRIISDLTDVNAVLQAIAEFDRLGREAFLKHYGFGESRTYMLSADGKLYDSKAIVGVAFSIQHSDQGLPTPNDFNGGEGTVARRLEELGFEVVRLDREAAWSREEVELAVSDYLSMLALEAAGSAFNKADHNRELRRHLQSRSKGSVEFKHQNISAILAELGLPYIQGYKPRSNVQELLRDVVVATVTARQRDLEQVIDDLEEVRLQAPPVYTAALIVEPPEVIEIPHCPRTRASRKCDWAARDEQNRTLGRAGEEWVFGFEKFRLTDVGRGDLAARVFWRSNVVGDGDGYDIDSFEREEAPRYVEVKTTNGPATTQFLVSPNEVECSREKGDAFCLYRVFDFRGTPRVFILRGDLDRHVSLSPASFRARLRSRRAN